MTQAWRTVADEYPGRVLIGEFWLADAVRQARHQRPDELPARRPGCAIASD